MVFVLSFLTVMDQLTKASKFCKEIGHDWVVLVVCSIKIAVDGCTVLVPGAG